MLDDGERGIRSIGIWCWLNYTHEIWLIPISSAYQSRAKFSTSYEPSGGLRFKRLTAIQYR